MKSNILVVYNEKHVSTLERTENILKKSGKKSSFIKFSELNDDYFDDRNLVITIGGDGTFIRTTHFMGGETPILGINSEPELSEGALTSLNKDEISYLEDIIEGNYKLIQRPRARAILNGQLIKELALNEVYVGTANQFHASRYIIEINGNKEEHRSSGVLVATGSGSTSWYKSAKGTPFDYNEEKLAYLVREPKTSRIFNPQLINGYIEKDKKITFKSTRKYGGIIAIDSWKVYDFNEGDIAEVRLSGQPLNVIVKNDK
jgi:NAD+ kinase